MIVPGGGALWRYPEGDPGHHDYKTGGDVGVKHKVPEQHKQVNLFPNNLTL